MLELTADARRRGDAFLLATVVWRRGPSSGKRGYKALVFPDGAVVGWLGGACAEPTVVREAKQALQDAHPRLMFLGPADELDGRFRKGVVSVPMACESEGALEVYLEPVLPVPHVVVIGRSPAVGTLASTWVRSSTTRSRSPSWPSWSAARRPASCAPASRPARCEVAIDPVCGMAVDVGTTARHRSEHAGNVYLFCAAGCQRHFEADPGKFLAEPHHADPPHGKSGCR